MKMKIGAVSLSSMFLFFVSVYPKTTGISHYKTMSFQSSFKLRDHIT